MKTMKKLANILWSLWATFRAVKKYGVNKALEEVEKELHNERIKYWKLTGKHPDEQRN